jgi:hypothetical protein
MFRFFAFAVFLLWAPAALAATSTVDLLRSLHLDPAYRQDLRERGYTGERFDIMIEHTRALFSDREIIGGLERRIAAVLRANGGKVNAQLATSLDTMLKQAEEDGITRLTPADRATMFSVDSGFIRAIPARDCTKLMERRISPERGQALLDAYMTQLPPRTLAAYQAATRSAMRQGLTHKRPAAAMGPAQVRSVEEAIYPQIDRMIAQQKNADRLYAAWAKGPQAAPKYACAFNQMFSAAALNLKGKQRDQAILYLMTQ